MWESKNGKLERSFEFDNFITAVNFVNNVAQIAEDMDHHPDILIHDYKWVKITTITHDKGEITDKDHALAEKVNALI